MSLCRNFLKMLTKKPPFGGFFLCYYLISLRRAAFPESSRIYPILFRRTLNLRRTSIFDIEGELIGKIFSIPIPSTSARTVIIRLSGVAPRIEMISPRNFWIRSLSPSRIIWWTSTSIPVSRVTAPSFGWVACIALRRIVSDIEYI